MILWTIQTAEAVATLERTGVLIANAGEPNPLFAAAYRWLSRQMTHRIGPAAEGARPLWAWHAWGGKKRPRPDLRCREYLEAGTRGARIELEAADNRVLLSDFSLWHSVLNDNYCATSERDWNSFIALESRLTATDIRLRATHPLLRAKTEASWERIFDLNRFREGWIANRAQKQIQATFWELPLHAVRDIKWFTARRRARWFPDSPARSAAETGQLNGDGSLRTEAATA